MSSTGSSRSKRFNAANFITEICGLDLRDFQVDWLGELLREKNGERVYSSALLGLPRGNGKTELAAAVALYMLVADGAPQPQVVLAAGSDKQAAEAFDAAKSMFDRSTWLKKKCEILRGRKVIRWRSDDNAWLRTVSAEGPLQHGMKPTCVVFDELWNQKKRELWEALTGGLVKRPEPLLVCISSAGYDFDGSLLGEEVRRGKTGEDPRFFYRWFSAPEEMDWRDPETWKLANPALTDKKPFLQIKGLEDNLRRMHENEFRRWHLGQWTASEDTWITGEIWDRCAGKPSLLPDHPTALGVDASIRRDSTVVATVQLRDGVFHVEFKVWEPTPGHEVPLDQVENFVREQGTEYNLLAVAYDPQFFTHASQRLEAEGVPMLEWRQDNARMVPATRTLHEAVSQGKLRHGGNSIARRHALNAAVVETERGLRVKKTASSGPDDSVVALAMAVEALSRKIDMRQESIYEQRDLAAA